MWLPKRTASERRRLALQKKRANFRYETFQATKEPEPEPRKKPKKKKATKRKSTKKADKVETAKKDS